MNHQGAKPSLLSKAISQLTGSQLRKNLFASGLSTIITSSAALLAYPINLHYLGFRDYGIWLALSGVTSLTALGGLGIAPAVTKYVAESWSATKSSDVERTVSTAYLMMFLIGSSIAISAIFLRVQICALFSFETQAEKLALKLIPWVAFLSAYKLCSQVAIGALSGLGRADKSASAMMLGRVITLGFSWFFLMKGHGLMAMIFGLAVGTFSEHLFAEVAIQSICRCKWFTRGACSSREVEKLLRYGGGVVGGSFMNMLLHPLNRLLLTRYAGVESVPVFEVAWSGSMQIRAVVSTALQALIPDFSRSHAKRDLKRTQLLMRRSYRLLLLGLPLFLFVITIAPWALRVWLQDGFRPQQIPCLRIMLVGAFVGMFGVPGFYYLLGVGKTSRTFTSQLIQSSTNILISGVAIGLGVFDPVVLCISVSTAAGFTTWYLAMSSHLHMKGEMVRSKI